MIVSDEGTPFRLMPAFNRFRGLTTWIAFSVLTLLIGGRAAAQAPLEGAYVAWSPDGQYIAVRYEDKVTIVDAATSQLLNTIYEPVGEAGEVAWSPDSRLLAVANGPNVSIWREPWTSEVAYLVTVYRYYEQEQPEPLSYSIDGLAWSPDGSVIASGVGARIDVWNPTNGVRLRSLFRAQRTVRDLSWSIDNRIAVGASDNFVLLINPDNDEFLRAFRHASTNVSVWAVDFSIDGTKLAMGTNTGGILVWDDTRTPHLLTELPALTLLGHQDYVFSLEWNTTGDLIASSSRDGTVRVFDPITGEQLQVIQVGSNVSVNSVAFSPDGTRLAYGVLDDMPVIIPAPVIDQPTATPSPTRAPGSAS
jgi:WD40 repeat protein